MPDSNCWCCNVTFEDTISESKCIYYDSLNRPRSVCVTCFEELGGYDEWEQRERWLKSEGREVQ